MGPFQAPPNTGAWQVRLLALVHGQAWKPSTGTEGKLGWCTSVCSPQFGAKGTKDKVSIGRRDGSAEMEWGAP